MPNRLARSMPTRLASCGRRLRRSGGSIILHGLRSTSEGIILIVGSALITLRKWHPASPRIHAKKIHFFYDGLFGVPGPVGDVSLLDIGSFYLNAEGIQALLDHRLFTGLPGAPVRSRRTTCSSKTTTLFHMISALSSCSWPVILVLLMSRTSKAIQPCITMLEATHHVAASIPIFPRSCSKIEQTRVYKVETGKLCCVAWVSAH
ncbi:hypothetical protein M430DRAFT_227564 [Amorphotheca resinae ATCC 22711]|uniref:Uncharacterized protein n=1 Tax=Amorphotheca resinae ATCC 22711 TaxID=857342 RepID=A0A2T3B759_AMORE|nr:hypothetical protein M430DRAFT_227564 [Amorphotheca resinae ATCC 22711]PSS22590.1 hypothetical protein M430DRAFT_227564 [Amorphotheca resinae ATCC 22711]